MRRLACAYAVVAALGIVIGLRNGDSAAPFGVRTGRSVVFDVAIGYGTASSAPWPMVLLLLARAGRNRRLVRVLAVMFLIGVASEHSTWQWEGRPGLERALVVSNILLPAWMLVRTRNVLGTVES